MGVYRRLPFVIRCAALIALLASASLVGARVLDPVTADVAIERAVRERVGEGVDVVVVSVDLPERAGKVFRRATPDPAARLGGPMRFTLVPPSGPAVVAVVTLRVTGEHVVAVRNLDRGQTVAIDDVAVVRDELRMAPLRRLPVGAQVIGSRVLRPVKAGAVVLPGAVAVRRAVEAGDTVTVTAVSGDIRVSAQLTATDGGDPGDVIRVVNTDTRRSLRGRIVREGMVEVSHAR
jgi:flagella basal body P-ring formation protein FlgA